MARSKPALPITRDSFRAEAKPLTVVINGKEFVALAKEFSTGSLGWNINEKLQIEVAGQLVPVQVGLNLTIIGSKDLPGSSPPAEKSATADEPAAAESPLPPPAVASQDVTPGSGQVEF